MPSRVLVSLDGSQWVQTFLCLCIITYHAYDVYLATRRSLHIPVSERCGPEYTEFAVRLGDTVGLQGRSPETGSDSYPPGSYWLDNNTIWGCPCRSKTCIPKCCPNGFSFVSTINRTCTAEPEKSFLELFNLTMASKLKSLKKDSFSSKDYLVFDNRTFGVPGNNSDIAYVVVEWSPLYLEDGVLFNKDSLFLELDKYCFESFINSSEILTFNYNLYEIDSDEYDNTEITEDDNELIVITVMIIIFGCGILSEVCLILTLVVYMCLPHLQNLQGKFLISYLLSLTMFYFNFYFTLQCEDCYYFDYFEQFFSLAFLSWLLVLCKDISDLVRKPLKSRSKGKPYWTTYLVYSLFGWGVPLFFTVLMASVGVVPNKSDSCPKPSYQKDACFFGLDRAMNLFLHIPDAVMVEMNFAIFLTLVWNLRSHFRQTKGISSQQAREDVEGFFLYMKLAFITGLNWFLLFYTIKPDIPNISFKIVIMILFNSQGFILSILLVCNRRVLDYLRQRCCCF